MVMVDFPMLATSEQFASSALGAKGNWSDLGWYRQDQFGMAPAEAICGLEER